jgi:hypothetical protein
MGTMRSRGHGDAGVAVGLLSGLLALAWTWAISQVYFATDEGLHIAGALALNGLLFAGAALAVRYAFPPRWATVAARWLLLVLLIVAAYAWARTVWPGLGTVPRALRLVLGLLVGAGAVRLAMHGTDAPWSRAGFGAAVASLIFVALPHLYAALRAPQLPWPPAPPAGAGAPTRYGNVVFLLFDEFGDGAHPAVTAALQRAGMQTRHVPLAAAGEDTLHVIPAMFTGQRFDDARPCGWSSICSGQRVLDFARVSASRADVSVYGMYHPYCEIRGLRHCEILQRPAVARNAYLRLANVYAARLGLPIRSDDEELAVARGLKDQVVQGQVDALMADRFWREGGVLYAHLPVPHPPGLTGWGKLDADYAANMEFVAELAGRIAARALARFGDDAAIVITSDHPLRRRVWCSPEVFNPYRNTGCELRPEFLSEQVPLIVASRREPALPAAASNAQAFGVLGALLRPAGLGP